VAQASCLLLADRLEAWPTLHSVSRFMAPMRDSGIIEAPGTS